MKNQAANPLSWQSQHPEKLPDFIIGGAMKSGTTTVHKILESHPDVAFAHEELGFFDMDDWLQHPDFNYFDSKKNQWYAPLLMKDNVLWNWYYSQFPERSNKTLIGEDSTTYLTSSRVAERLAMQHKPIKVIFVLRHPTKRCISNYLHAVKSGRAFDTFENTLKYNPHSIIKRSLYKEQLEVYYKHLPANQIKVILFEDLVSNKRQTVQDLCDFLGLDVTKIPSETYNLHANKTKIPKYFKLQIWRNRILRSNRDGLYVQKILAKSIVKKPSVLARLFNAFHKKINPLQSTRTFLVNSETEQLLDAYFKSALKGIDELTQTTILGRWFKD